MNDISVETHESIDAARIAYLKDQMDVEDEELIYLNRILKLQYKRRELILNRNTPSVIIDDFLYQSDINDARNMNLLNKLGIQHIINTCNISLPKLITEKFNVLWINIVDDSNKNIAQYFHKTNDFLSSCKQKNEKVLVHCQMGISRSSSIILAYLIKYHHDTLFNAYDNLLNRHPFAAPNYGFFIQLIRYEKELHQIQTT
ncbi:unnamed protein product [Adineta steineri]|uniref:Uncharacterized protein n=1 Tax=Adineta steineri TaxID=433720 RepID=A0A814QX04_9BILA|nr:unnamed protein product [Adineta steineri]CAF1145486.1 unnamed protein product [Adineta steineri]